MNLNAGTTGDPKTAVESCKELGVHLRTVHFTQVVVALALMFATGLKQGIAISLECGLQNGTLAIAVATLLFGGGLAVVPAATYSLIMFATALIFIALLRKAVAET